jgi:hypothetical protein
LVKVCQSELGARCGNMYRDKTIAYKCLLFNDEQRNTLIEFAGTLCASWRKLSVCNRARDDLDVYFQPAFV